MNGRKLLKLDKNTQKMQLVATKHHSEGCFSLNPSYHSHSALNRRHKPRQGKKNTHQALLYTIWFCIWLFIHKVHKDARNILITNKVRKVSNYKINHKKSLYFFSLYWVVFLITIVFKNELVYKSENLYSENHWNTCKYYINK